MFQTLTTKNFWVVNILSFALTYAFVFAITGALGLPAIPNIEIIATALNMTCVWFMRQEEVWGWPIGILASALLAFTFFGYDLPGQAWLQIAYFIPIQVYGWYLWMKKRQFGDQMIPEVWVSKLKYHQWCNCFYVLIFGTLMLALVLGFFYGGLMPQRLWDASIVIASIIGQQLLNRKRVESWWFWLIPVNVSSIVLFIIQGAYLYAAMYLVFFIHAAWALYQWYIKSRYFRQDFPQKGLF